MKALKEYICQNLDPNSAVSVIDRKAGYPMMPSIPTIKRQTTTRGIAPTKKPYIKFLFCFDRRYAYGTNRIN